LKKISFIIFLIFINISLFSGSYDNDLYWKKFEEPVNLKFARPALLDKDGKDALKNTIWTKTWKEDFNITVENIWDLPNFIEINKYISNGVFTGELPDYMVLNKNNYDALLQADRLQNLSDYEKYMTPFLKYEVYDLANSNVQRVCIVDGKRYAIMKDHCAQTKNAFFVRKDFLEEIGAEQPKTIEDLIIIGKTFVDRGFCEHLFGFNENILNFNVLNINLFLNAYGSYGDMWLKNDNGRFYNSVTSDETKVALDVLRELYAEGYINKKYSNSVDLQKSSFELYNNGELGIISGSYELITCLLSNIKDKVGNNTDWEIYTALPSKANNNYHISGALSKADNSYIAISANCEKPEALIRTMNFKAAVLSDPNYYDENFHTQVLDNGTEISNHMNCLLSGYFNSSKCENIPNSKVITYAIDNGDISKLNDNNLIIYNEISEYIKQLRKGEPFSSVGWKYYKLFYSSNSFFGQLNDHISNDLYRYDEREYPTSYYDLLHVSLNDYACKYFVEYITGTNTYDFKEFKNTFMDYGGQLIADELNYKLYR
jgi:putative aldouronate transport system substrate-binding protein